MAGKQLEIVYDGRILFTGSVVEFTWTETENGVSVKGAFRGQQQGPTLGDLIGGLKRGAAPDAPNGQQGAQPPVLLPQGDSNVGPQ